MKGETLEITAKNAHKKSEFAAEQQRTKRAWAYMTVRYLLEVANT